MLGNEKHIHWSKKINYISNEFMVFSSCIVYAERDMSRLSPAAQEGKPLMDASELIIINLKVKSAVADKFGSLARSLSLSTVGKFTIIM